MTYQAGSTRVTPRVISVASSDPSGLTCCDGPPVVVPDEVGAAHRQRPLVPFRDHGVPGADPFPVRQRHLRPGHPAGGGDAVGAGAGVEVATISRVGAIITESTPAAVSAAQPW